ncbi:metal-dependent transcriptional regulator [candidate division KSB1 bacterium]|nr:metal-dependent transcriptional regulator [candidate division KSB1 bacterium]
MAYDITTQEYIKVIFSLEREHRVARVTDIAKRRGVTKSSVSLVLNQLQKKALIDRKQYGHITLTKSGRRLGSELHKRHQTIKVFLVRVLGVSEKIADRDACKIEHDLSQQTWTELRRFITVMQNCPNHLIESLASFRRCSKFASGDLKCETCMEIRRQST